MAARDVPPAPMTRAVVEDVTALNGLMQRDIQVLIPRQSVFSPYKPPFAFVILVFVVDEFGAERGRAARFVEEDAGDEED